jgi:hypothetical protein
MNRTTNSVIHQKNKLTINQRKKLCPLLLAIEAGMRAMSTHMNTKNAAHIALNVNPNIVVANIHHPPSNTFTNLFSHSGCADSMILVT